jgi:hypothetical protein
LTRYCEDTWLKECVLIDIYPSTSTLIHFFVYISGARYPVETWATYSRLEYQITKFGGPEYLKTLTVAQLEELAPNLIHDTNNFLESYHNQVKRILKSSSSCLAIVSFSYFQILFEGSKRLDYFVKGLVGFLKNYGAGSAEREQKRLKSSSTIAKRTFLS